MPSPHGLSHHSPSMAKHSFLRGRASPCFTEACLFFSGVFMALLLVWSFSCFPSSIPSNLEALVGVTRAAAGGLAEQEGHCGEAARLPDFMNDPPDETFYDDPELSYSMDKPVNGWDEKRKEWLRRHPSFAGGPERVVLVTGSQATPCQNKMGDHLLLRFFKNKVDYCRIHRCDVYYSNVLLQPKMKSFWAKYPAVRAAMLAHPEAEWIWWVDSDAIFTDMDFTLPLDRYRSHNLVVHGWAHLVHEKKSWTSINAGVFLIRNCQWSMDFIDKWASTGPQSPDYERWGEVYSSIFKDKLFPGSDDQSALIYLILKHRQLYEDKIYIEGEYYFQGYWLDIVPTLRNISRKYMEIEIEDETGILSRRHAEKVADFYSRQWEQHLREAGNGRGSWRRPFMTHFTGCQPCSGDHNQIYSGESCWTGMLRALNFADSQVLRNYGFIHRDLLDSEAVVGVPFGFPATQRVG